MRPCEQPFIVSFKRSAVLVCTRVDDTSVDYLPITEESMLVPKQTVHEAAPPRKLPSIVSFTGAGSDAPDSTTPDDPLAQQSDDQGHSLTWQGLYDLR